MKTNKEIIKILKSIQDVRLSDSKKLEVKFSDTSNIEFPNGYESISGYNSNSFTEQLLLLIEASLKGEVD